MDDDSSAFAAFCGIVLVGGMVSLGVGAYAAGVRAGVDTGCAAIREEAVLRGVAEWTSDESGKPVFTWKGGE